MAVLSEVAAAQNDSPERVEPRHSLPAQPSEKTHINSPESPRPSSPTPHWNRLPGFAHIDGDVNGRGYNETLVDIVCVPCPGADPVETWARDPLPEGYFGRPSDVSISAVKELAGASILSPTINRHLPMATHLWVRQGIRKEVSEARVLLYRHRELVEGMTLDDLALDLIEQVWNVRYGNVSAPRLNQSERRPETDCTSATLAPLVLYRAQRWRARCQAGAAACLQNRAIQTFHV